MEFVEGPQRRAEQEEQQAGGDRQRGVGVDTLAGGFLGVGREVALHDGLVRAVGGDVGEDGGDEHRPDRRLAQVEERLSEAEFPGVACGGEDRPEAFGQLEGDGADDRHGGAQQYDHLHGFGPDHGLDAAHERIGEAQNAHHADTEEDVDARHDVQRD